MSATTEITLEQLASVDAKMLFKALEMRLSSAGVLKKRGKKASKAASGDDSASTTSREQPAAVKEWQSQMAQITAVYKTLVAASGEKMPAGSHMRVAGIIRKAGKAESFSEADVSEAIAFLKANPLHKSDTQERRASKGSGEEGSDGEVEGESIPTPKKPVVLKKAAPASEDKKAEKEAAKEAATAAKKAEKEAAAAAKKAEKEAAAAAKKAEKEAAKKGAKKAAPKAEASAEAEAEPSLDEIEFDGVSYFWDSASGKVYENLDGHPGELFGTWNGEGDIEPSA